MDAHDVCPCADRPYYHADRDVPEAGLRRSEPRVIFDGLPGLALAARLCRTQLDDGTWTGLADTARKLGDREAYRVKDSANWKVKCACEAVHVVPPREIVACECGQRVFLADADAAWVFELPPGQDYSE